PTTSSFTVLEPTSRAQRLRLRSGRFPRRETGIGIVRWTQSTISTSKRQISPLPQSPQETGGSFLPAALPRSWQRPAPDRRQDHRERNPVVRKVLKPAFTRD